MTVTRTWKRDGSANRMALAAAAKNLAIYCVEPEVRGAPLGDIEAALLDGESFETPLATFAISPRDRQGNYLELAA